MMARCDEKKQKRAVATHVLVAEVEDKHVSLVLRGLSAPAVVTPAGQLGALQGQ